MFDVAIIGAGPAGMQAALQAGHYTDKVLIVDTRPEPGGNVYASVTSSAKNFPEQFQKLDTTYRSGLALVERFLNRGLDYRPCTSVWHLDEDGEMACRGPDGAYTVQAKKVILCTGAYERPLPLPGWTLPGVMGVGAAQIALKSSAVLPKSPTVIVGDGPLTLLYARQLRRAGGRISAFVIPEPANRAGLILPGARAALMNPAQTALGLSMLLDRTLAGTEVFRGANRIEITGEDRVTGVRFEVSGKRVERAAATVLLHDGIIPDINISAGSGLQTAWSGKREYWHPVLDAMGRSSHQNVFVAGDAGGIAGAAAAHLSGKRAALAACVSLDLATERDQISLCGETDKALSREMEFRRVLERLYPPAFSGLTQSDDLTICRCEAVSVGDIRRELAEMKNANADPNRLKSVLRCGMGPCQGRNCALSVANLVAREMGAMIDQHALPRARAPYTQVTLGELANLSSESG